MRINLNENQSSQCKYSIRKNVCTAKFISDLSSLYERRSRCLSGLCEVVLRELKKKIDSCLACYEVHVASYCRYLSCAGPCEREFAKKNAATRTKKVQGRRNITEKTEMLAVSHRCCCFRFHDHHSTHTHTLHTREIIGVRHMEYIF